VTASWLFLAVSIFGALCTLMALHPPQRPGILMVAGFFTAWLTSELALVFITFQVIATVIFLAFGALDAWPGWVGLAITLVSWFGLITAVRAARATHQGFADALHETLGIELPPTRAERHRLWLPFRMRRRGVERIRNVQYVDDGRRRHRLDIYRPAEVPTGAPVLLQIHGGAWTVGNKDHQAQPLMYHLAQQGWICVAINYGLSPRTTWPGHLVNCKRALAWVRDRIAEYGGDPNFVVVTGGSAGGHLAAMMGLTANDPVWQPGFESVDTSVQAMIPFYGVYDWTSSATSRDRGLRRALERTIVKQRFADARDIYDSASPMFRVHADAPPALVVHGTLDNLAPIAEAREFVARLRAVSRAPVVYVELHGASHAFDVFNSIRSLQAISGVDAFLNWVRSEGARPSVAPAAPGADPIRTAAKDAPAIDPTPTARTAP
jgi:acetyl esterase/lipase